MCKACSEAVEQMREDIRFLKLCEKAALMYCLTVPEAAVPSQGIRMAGSFWGCDENTSLCLSVDPESLLAVFGVP